MALTTIDQVLTIKTDQPITFFTSMCCRTDGCLMVINGGTNRIHVYSAAGQLMQTNYGNRLLNKRLTTPTLITEMLDKTLAIFDKSTKQVKKLSRGEDHIATFDIGMGTDSLAINHYGHLVMAHQADRGKRIVSIRDSKTGYVLHFLQIPPHRNTLPGAPFYAVYSLPSHIITLDQSSCSLSLHTIDGVVQQTVGKHGFLPGNLYSPSSLALDINGNVVVADTKNNRIVRYRADDLKTSDILLSDVSSPLYVTFDKFDHLMVVTAKNIFIYDYDIRTRPIAHPVPALIDGVL